MSSEPMLAADLTVESPLQEHGYIRCYRAIAEQCGRDAAYLYGILEDYAQIGARTGLGCIPSHDKLAHDMGCGERSIRTYLRTLRDAGWIAWTTERGGNNHYTILGKNCRQPRQELPPTPARIAAYLEPLPSTIELVETTSLDDGAKKPAYTEDFLQFWALYPRGRGSKFQAFTEWRKLKAAERRAALERLPAFVASAQWQKEGGRFVVHAERWLKRHGWEDDVPPDVPTTNGYRNWNAAGQVDAYGNPRVVL